MLLLLFLCTQLFSDSPEGKFIDVRPWLAGQRAESLHSFDVLKYELNLTVPMTARSLSGTNVITCLSRTDGLLSVTLHSYTLTIDSIKVDEQAASFATADETLHIELPQTYNSGDTLSIRIDYHGSWTVGNPRVGFVYYPKNYNVSTLHSIAYTFAEPWDARRWMPCYDEPYDKADNGCVISVTVPDTFVVCANGELIDTVNNPDNTKTFIWQENYPIATYLMHFAASRYAQWSDWYHESSGDSIELRYYVWPQDSAKSDTAFQCIPVAMALFDSMFGSYPFDRYGQDVVYPFVVAGMEHQEISTITRGWLLYKEETGMAHELAHMWWGDMVTCVDFRDIWLNEGFASYSDVNYRWYRVSYDYFLTTMQARANAYFSADAAWRHPIYDPPLSELFNAGHTYYKACWVVHMLRYLNQDSFFPALHAYRDSLEYGTANTEDLKNIFSDIYATDLTWFFDEWVYDQGYPEYEIRWICNPAGAAYRTILDVYQTQNNAPTVFHMPVQVLLHMTTADTLLEMPISASPEHVEVVVSDSVTSIEFDPYKWLLKKYDIYLLDSIAPSAPHIADVEKSDTNAALFWNTVTEDTLGGNEIMDYYIIYRSTSPSFVPGQADSIGTVQHPETTYIDTGAVVASQDYYYLMKAVDMGRNKSKNSNMGYVFNKPVNENVTTTDRNWVSLPWYTNYTTVSDVTADMSPLGDPLVKLTNLRDDNKYESWLWDPDFGEWYGTDFTITPGRGYEFVTVRDDTLVLVGSNNPDGLVSLNENPATTDRNWVSVPYNHAYGTVSAITTEYSPAGNPLVKCTNLRDDNKYESWLWDPDFGEWYGTDFTIERGRGYEFVTVVDTMWNPTEFSNEAGAGFVRQNKTSHIEVYTGSDYDALRVPVWSDEAAKRDAERATGIGQGVGNVSHVVHVHCASNDYEHIVFTAYRPDQPYDVLTESTTGSGVAWDERTAIVWFDVGNFETPWKNGEEVILIIEALKQNQGYYVVLNFQLEEKVDIQNLGAVELVKIPEATDNVIGYSIYRGNERLNGEILYVYEPEEGTVVRPVIRGGYETVYSSGPQTETCIRVPVSYDFRLAPNPFERRIYIDFALPVKTVVQLVVYDVSGRKINTLASGIHEPGYYGIQWDGTDGAGRHVASGVYFIGFFADGYDKHAKLVLIR